MLKDFKDFVLRGNVVDLAVAFIIGTAFSTVVKAIVADLFTPILAIPGKTNFSSLAFHVGHSNFLYGDFLNALIAFLVVAFVLFFFIVRPIEAVNRRLKRRAGDVPPETKDCPECLSTIPYAAHRCAFCTTEFADATGVPAGV